MKKILTPQKMDNEFNINDGLEALLFANVLEKISKSSLELTTMDSIVQKYNLIVLDAKMKTDVVNINEADKLIKINVDKNHYVILVEPKVEVRFENKEGIVNFYTTNNASKIIPIGVTMKNKLK